MLVCPTCKAEVTTRDQALAVCAACGHSFETADPKRGSAAERLTGEPQKFGATDAITATPADDIRSTATAFIGSFDDDASRGPVPSLLAQPPAVSHELRNPPPSDIPAGVNFGAASPPWPDEDIADVPAVVQTSPTAFTPSTLHTVQSVPFFPVDAGTRDDEQSLRTIDSGAAGASADAIVALWSGTHSDATTPRTSIRRPDELTGSPRDSRLIITGRTVRQTQSPLRASADYELLSTIGEGGVGVVYAARQAAIDRTVAVKMLKPASAQKPEQREKFLSEAVVTGDLDHPNIVPIYDLGTNESGALFYSMKRVQGTPWSSVLSQKSLAENVDILMKVADAAGFAHSRGVIHRDLKPENVMLGEYGEVLVMDWGLALVTPEFRKARTISPSTSMGGTPAYMAPEMAIGPVARLTRASDVYLLGAILYEIITGQPPHTAKNVSACLVAAARNEIQPTQHHGELLEIALKAMATRPEDRFATARDFQIAVRQYQAHSESIVLSDRAERDLAEARKRNDYELFSRAVFGYQEAFALWEQNPHAESGISKAKLEYAESAKHKGDYDLATSLLDANDPAHAPLRESVAAAQHERALRKQRLKHAKRIATALAAAMLVVVTGALVWVSHLYGVAEHEAEIAIEEKHKADVAKDDAIEATGRAVRNYKVAQKERANAERAKREEEYAGYIAKIGLAAVKVEENAFGEVDQLLDQCPPRLRNWEWGRLKFLCGRALRTFAAGAPLEAVAFDHSGQLFATGGTDGAVRVWSIDNIRQPQTTLAYGDPYVFTVAFSPDGRHVAAGGNDKTGGFVKIWEIETKALVKTLHGHTEAVLSVAYNADGSRLLTASSDCTARLWDAHSGESLRTFAGHTWWVWSAEFSPTEDAIVTAGQDRKCIVWPLDGSDTTDVNDLLIFNGHEGPVFTAVFSPDGNHIVSGGYDNRILVWHRDQAKPFAFDAISHRTKTAPPVFRPLIGHTAPVHDLRFIRHGRPRILSASHDNTLKVWDFETGELIQTLRGHAGWARACDVTSDGRLAVSASHDRQAKLWNLEGYEEVKVLNARVLLGHSDAITSAHFSADGKQILTSSRDRTARIWSFETGEMLKSFAEGHDYLASHAIRFRDGRRFLTSGIDSTVRIWDMATGTETRTFTGTGTSGMVALSGDERWMVTASGNAALLWDVSNGELVRKLGGHHGEVAAIAVSPDGRYVFTGDLTGRTKLWDRASGQVVWNQRAHSDSVNAAAFTPDGRRVLTASSDNTVGQFDVATGRDLIHETLKHSDAVTAIAVSPDGKRAVTNAGDGKVRIWDLTQRRIEHELEGLPALVSSFAFSDDGSQLVTVAPMRVTSDGNQTVEQPSIVQFWDTASGRERPQTRMHTRMVWSAIFAPVAGEVLLVGGDRATLCQIGSDQRIMSFSPHRNVTSSQFSPDQSRIVTSGGDVSAKVWDVATGKALFKLALLHEGAINSAVYSPDGATILTASDDRTARLWNAATGELVRTYPDAQTTGHTDRVRSAAFSPDGRYIVTASDDATVRVWNLTGGVAHILDGHKSKVVCAAFSPDGSRIVTGSENNLARIWDADTGKLLGELAGHTAAVTSACFSSDGLRVLTGSQDSTAKLWDAKTTKEILTLKGHTDEVSSVSFSNDGRYVLSGSRDGSAIVWLTQDWRDEAQGSVAKD